MSDDEKAIRELVTTWLRATAEGDLPRILSLMAEDVVFLVAGQPPMRGRDGFAEAFRAGSPHVQIEATSEIQEIQTFGDWAYCWNQLQVTVTPRSGGQPMRRSGPALTILRKQADGGWVVYRDANLVMAEPPASS